MHCNVLFSSMRHYCPIWCDVGFSLYLDYTMFNEFHIWLIMETYIVAVDNNAVCITRVRCGRFCEVEFVLSSIG